MKRIASCCAIVVFAAVSPRAAQDRNDALAREIAARVLDAGMYDLATEQGISVGMQDLISSAQAAGNPFSEADLETIRGAFDTAWRQVISEERFVAGFTDVYKQHFTGAELQELLEFYDTPLGRLLLEKTAPVTRAGAELGETLAATHQAEFMEAFQEALPQ